MGWKGGGWSSPTVPPANTTLALKRRLQVHWVHAIVNSQAQVNMHYAQAHSIQVSIREKGIIVPKVEP